MRTTLVLVIVKMYVAIRVVVIVGQTDLLIKEINTAIYSYLEHYDIFRKEKYEKINVVIKVSIGIFRKEVFQIS